MKIRLTMLEFVDSHSDKFYNIFVAKGDRALVHWGRRGTRGSFQMIPWTHALDRLDQKQRKGYAVVLQTEFEYDDSWGWEPEALLTAANRCRQSGRQSGILIDQEAIFVW